MTDASLLPAPIENEKKRKYTAVDAAFAGVFFLLGYFCCRFCFYGGTFRGLGPLTAILALFGVSLLYLRIRRRRISRRSALHLAVILAISSGLLFSDNGFIRLLTVGYALISWLYWYFRACRDGAEAHCAGDGGMLFFDLLKSVLVMPFSCLGSAFGACGHTLKHSAAGKKILLAAGGLLIAVLPTAAVLRLLISADGAFANLTKQITDSISGEWPVHLLCFLFGLPLAAFLFGALYAGGADLNRDILTEEDRSAAEKAVRILPALFTAAAVTPVLLVYLLFFFSQTSYFLSAFSGIRPADFTYAQYARQGFFELCGVSVINLGIITVMSLLTKRQEGKRSLTVTVYSAILSVCTLALIAIALSKMFMYIGAYGLTLLRIYTTWFMILLAVLFLLILLRQFIPRLGVIRVFSVCFTVLFAVLIFADADAIAARSNVYLYESGKTDSVDFDMMINELSCSAIPYLLPLTEDENEDVADMAKMTVACKWASAVADDEKLSFTDFNLAVYRADRLLKSIDPAAFPDT